MLSFENMIFTLLYIHVIAMNITTHASVVEQTKTPIPDSREVRIAEIFNIFIIFNNFIIFIIFNLFYYIYYIYLYM